MMTKTTAPRYVAHPWHGIEIGEGAPARVTAFIEMVPTDVVKYEIDKCSGHLKVDRPHKFSSQCPCLYGFIPQTYCGERVGAFSAAQENRKPLRGDGDPLDICVLSERPILHGNVVIQAVPIGGLRIIDRDEADDKILAVLFEDAVHGQLTELSQVQTTLIDRIIHYFLTYKQMPGEEARRVELGGRYGAEQARQVIKISIDDYRASFSSDAAGR